MKKIFLILCILISTFYLWDISVFAVDTNLNITNPGTVGAGTNLWNTTLTNFRSDRFISVGRLWDGGIFNTLIRIARDLKNIFYIIATIFFLVISLRLIFASNTEEATEGFKKWIIWITLGLIVMQLAFIFVDVLANRAIGATLAKSLYDTIVSPLVMLLLTLASIFFLAMAIFAFYRLVTANGNEEAVSSWKMTIIYAIIWFIIVRFAKEIVEAFYGRLTICWWGNVCNILEISAGVNIIITIINWLNGFVAIVMIIMIIYAGVQIMLSHGDEEKIKKWKNSLLYIFIGMLILITNYLILTFFLIPETTI